MSRCIINFKKLGVLRFVFVHIWEDMVYTFSFLKKHKDEDEEVIFALLRQNTHILDKGLHIIPFEKGHSMKIYQLCKNLKDKITNKQIKSDSAFLWIESVIAKYEQAQKAGAVIEYKIKQPVYSKKDKAEFYKIIKSRTSCRNFTNEIISDETWNEILVIAADAPSGCCRQTERYYIENDSEKIRALVPNIVGATGFSSTIPYLICIAVDIRPYGIQDRLLPYIDASLSIQNFLLACTVNNIYGTLLNFQHATIMQIEKCKKILNIPEYERIIIFIAVGKTEKLPLKPARMNINKIRKK
jgi:nitroreductase